MMVSAYICYLLMIAGIERYEIKCLTRSSKLRVMAMACTAAQIPDGKH